MRVATSLGSLLLVVTGTACNTYAVRQSSLVPVATIPSTPEYDRAVDLTVANTTVTFLDAPELAPNEKAGLYLPRTQFEGTIAINPLSWLRATRFTRPSWLSLRMHYLEGLLAGSMPASPTVIPRPRDDVRGFGTGFAVRLPGSAKDWVLSLALDLWRMSVPTHLSYVCIEDDDPWTSCSAADSGESFSSETVSMTALSAFGAKRVLPELLVFGAMSLKTHPTNVDSLVESGSDAPYPVVSSGEWGLLLGLGLEINVTSFLTLVPELQVPVTADPIRYGPIVGVGIRAGAG